MAARRVLSPSLILAAKDEMSRVTVAARLFTAASTPSRNSRSS